MSEYEIRDRAVQSIVGFIWARSACDTWFPCVGRPALVKTTSTTTTKKENSSFITYASNSWFCACATAAMSDAPNEARDGIFITRTPAPEHSTEQHQAAPTFPPPRATGAAERQPGGSREPGAHDECTG
ncbi:hypothetical protein V493_02268 [Pseudogymnoascus sp. VKM F-4281 (FW-2241)]|nr:hypothetical protein V493_02268 [Pseudogymnoascus sp. VKM F-4281 (FW-2241)]